MKFLLVPLLIIGMFVSFGAAMVAMLFFTETIKTKEDLEKIISGEVDSSRLSADFIDPEDKLEKLTMLVEDYRQQYELDREILQDSIDSLNQVQAGLAALEMSLDAREQQLARTSKSVRDSTRLESIKQLTAFYNKLKPDPAAEILQAGALDDTTVAMLMKELQPAHMAKIMQSMQPSYAAEVTKIIQEF